MLKITPYSDCYGKYIVTSNTENISNVVDKMIRLTAKITEAYAGDIYFDIKGLTCCTEEHEPYDRVLFFREGGVWTVNTNELDEYTDMITHIQAWRLVHDPENMTTTLIRVYVTKERK